MYYYMMQTFLADELLFYLRKSRADDPMMTVAEILERHEQQLDEWVARNVEGGRVPESNRYREVGSGETIASRPRLQELLRRIEAKEIKAIVIKDTSRLSRGDLQDIGYLLKVFEITGVKVITLDRGIYDLTNERDRDDFKRELMRGNEYLDYVKKIQNAGRLMAAKNGYYIGSKEIYGYKKIAIKVSGRTCHTLEPIPEQAEAVKRIFTLYSQGLGCERIADALEAEHVPSPGGDGWYKETILRMLDNVHYIGKVKWGHRKEVKNIIDGQVVVSRPRSRDYPVFDGIHEAIVPIELWNAVREIRGKIPRNNKAGNFTNPLAGLLYCAVCGRAMVGRPYRDKEGRERSAPRYLCQGRKRCEQGSARMVDVLAEVEKVLVGAIADFEVRVESGEDDRVEQYNALIARLEKKLETLRETEVKQWEEKMENGMPDHVFRKLNEATLQAIDDVQQALYDAMENPPEQVDLGERIVTFKEALEALRDPEAPIKEKNLLLKACIERIEYRRERYTERGTPRGVQETPIHLDFTLRI